MSDKLRAVRKYLLAPPDSFWKWTEDGDAIVWTDNRTIVFRQELETVLRRQVSAGLPVLSSVIFLLAACRDSWPESSAEVGVVRRLVDQLGTSQSSTSEERSRHDQWLDAALENLDRVHALPADLRHDARAKAELVAMVLEDWAQDRTTPEVAAEIVDFLASGPPGEMLQETVGGHGHLVGVDGGVHVVLSPVPTVGRVLRDLHTLAAGLTRVDADALRRRLTTGLEREVQPADVDEPLARQVRKLLEQLKHDAEFSPIVGLARNLMAIVQLPRPLEEQEEIPAGGVSDISNRGTLDRLLMSELAQDDQTLMVRLAMNEALYLRRETPTCNPPRGRLLLLDAGLRMWGVPRVFATAVALSLAATTEKSIALSVLRPEGNRLVPVDLSTRDGLTEHLSVLRPEAHPGGALADLGPRLDECGAPADTILITGEDVAADRDFRRDLADTKDGVAYMITVSRRGDFRLIERTLAGTKLLREAKLDVESLLKPASKPAVPLIDLKRAADLPAILRVKPFPLRLSHEVNPRQTWWAEKLGVLSITDDRRLMHWDAPGWGARQLKDQLPSRHVLWHRGPVDGRRAQFVVGDPGTSRLWLFRVDLQDDEHSVASLGEMTSPVKCVCDHAGALFVVQSGQINVYDLQSGNHLPGLAIPQDGPAGFVEWIHGRFFRGTRWWALSYDGKSARFEAVLKGQIADNLAAFLGMFDVEGVQGPVAMSSVDGSLFLTAENTFLRLKEPLRPPIRLLRIASDGKKVLVQHGTRGDAARREMAVVDTMAQTVQTVQGTAFQLERGNFHEVVRPRNLLNHFLAVGTADCYLVLETRQHHFFLLAIDPQGDFHLRHAPALNREHLRALVPLGLPFGVKYRLKAATFGDGSKVFLDSRGLLHLKSSNSRIPELSFVLCQGQLAAWCADGRMSGSQYYLGNKPPVRAAEIFETVLFPFVSRLR